MLANSKEDFSIFGKAGAFVHQQHNQILSLQHRYPTRGKYRPIQTNT
jgi:hypothetical protein